MVGIFMNLVNAVILSSDMVMLAPAWFLPAET